MINFSILFIFIKDFYYPNNTSKIIIIIKPNKNAISLTITLLLLLFIITSSITTINIAPAPKLNIKGIRFFKYNANKKPKTEAIGSTIPDIIPNNYDFFLEFVFSKTAKEVAAPSGIFCIPIPRARIIGTI